MASEIAETYTERREGFTIVTVLTGSLIFLADLIPRLPMRMKIGLVAVSAYPGAMSAPRRAAIVAPARPARVRCDDRR